MTAIAPIVVWCFAGCAGLRFGGAGSAHGRIPIADYIFAAFLGPFSFLISFLADHMMPDGDEEEGVTRRQGLGRDGRDHSRS